MPLRFDLLKTSPQSAARRGRLHIRNGRVVETPCFMPVGTVGALQGIDTPSLARLGYGVLLANTFHLLQRPGLDVLRAFGGLHNFMKWDGALLTDSGGFQVFSLAAKLQMSEEGVRFRSYLDGTSHLLTPERSIEIQEQYIGSDIMMVLDECVPSMSTYEISKAALERTTRWAARSLAARTNPEQAIFGIVQGATYPDLRKESAAQICSLPFDGVALGGLAVGEERLKREEVTAFAAALLPKEKPHYLMGVGTPLDLIEAVRCGIDMFDCILPTALSRQGVAYTNLGKVHFRRGVYKLSQEPIDKTCNCFACRTYSRAYIQHLVRSREVYGEELIAVHNLTFYANLMQRIRTSLEESTFEALHRELYPVLGVIDIENPSEPPVRKNKTAKFSLGDFEVQIEGTFGRIKQKSSGERMHPIGNPRDEARTLYLEQSRFKELLADTTTAAAELVIWDVGLGAASNAMEFVLAYEAAHATRSVRIVSFETDLDALKLALKFPSLFPSLRHQAPYMLLQDGRWQRPEQNLVWELKVGDFREFMHSVAKPDVILYDPFSQRATPELWGKKAFAELFKAVSSPKTASLFTYANSTAIRAALLSAGFWVANGAATGPKEATTVAYSKRPGEQGFPLIGKEWLGRWERSDARYPLDLEKSGEQEFREKLLAHPQFG